MNVRFRKLMFSAALIAKNPFQKVVIFFSGLLWSRDMLTFVLTSFNSVQVTWRHAAPFEVWRDNQGEFHITSRHLPHDVTWSVLSSRVSVWSWLPLQLLDGYLWNRMVDFAHFLQANLYDRLNITCQKPSPCTQYFSFERISWFPWQPIRIFQWDPDHTKGGTLL